jgi:hypothetical protein
MQDVESVVLGTGTAGGALKLLVLLWLVLVLLLLMLLAITSNRASWTKRRSQR